MRRVRGKFWEVEMLKTQYTCLPHLLWFMYSQMLEVDHMLFLFSFFHETVFHTEYTNFIPDCVRNPFAYILSIYYFSLQ